MFIGILKTRFRLHGCASLKEKRRRLSGLREKFGKINNIAVCESNYQNTKELSEISFICVATDSKVVESALAKIVNHCTSSVDAEITHHSLEWG